MSRRVEHLQPQGSDGQHLAVVQPQIHERRGTRAMHGNGNVQSAGNLSRSREMIGVSVRVDQVVNAQAVTRRQGEITVDQGDLRVDEDRRAAFLATDQVGLAASRTEMFENHLALIM